LKEKICLNENKIPLTKTDIINYIALWACLTLITIAYITELRKLEFLWIVINTFIYFFLLYIVIVSTATRYNIIICRDYIKVHIPGHLYKFISINYDDILLTSFVRAVYAPLLQLIKKKVYSDIVAVFICYRKKNKIKRAMVYVDVRSAEKLQNLFTEKGIKIVSPTEFMVFKYNCKKYLLHESALSYKLSIGRRCKKMRDRMEKD